MASSYRVLGAIFAPMVAAACGSSAHPRPVISTTTTTSAVAERSVQGLAIAVESDGATLLRDVEGRTQASLLVFETAFAAELRAEFPELGRHYVARLAPGTKARAVVETWAASGVISRGAVSLSGLERFADQNGIELRKTLESKTALDDRFVARACERCIEEHRVCDASRAAQRHYARAGVAVTERSCEAELQACALRANPAARQRDEATACGPAKP